LKTLFVAIPDLKTVLALQKAPTGMELNAYALHNILSEMINVNTICGVATANVTMEKIVIIALLIVHIPANQRGLCVAMEFVQLKAGKIVTPALKIVVLALFQYVVMVIVISTLMKIAQPVLEIVVYAL
jgi:hypothetical protein